MAYIPQYKSDFQNELQEDVSILIEKKDGPAVTVENFAAVECRINTNSDSGLLLDPIITRSMTLYIDVPATSSITGDTFLDSFHDDWRVTATIDGRQVFQGYLLPDEGPIPMQDKPYEIVLQATDGLKLLNKVKLAKSDGTEFNAKHTIIEYITAILSQTHLQLNIKIYSNLFHSAMQNRLADVKNDMFNQAYLDYRSFMTSSTDFVDCYTALQMLLQDNFRLYYDNGQWVIFHFSETQQTDTTMLYYTLYDYTGAVIGGGNDSQDFGKVGKSEIVRAINENQTISANFANKSITHNYDYRVWDEIPRNNKFERGNFVSPIGDATHRWFTINNWTVAKINSGNYPVTNAITTTTGTVRRLSTLNNFGVELSREVVFDHVIHDSPGTLRDILVSEDIPVDVNDIVEVNFQFRVEIANGLTNTLVMNIFIVPEDGSPIIQMSNSAGTLTENIPWTSTNNGLVLSFAGADPTQYIAFSAKAKAIPKAGKMYINFVGWINEDYGKWYFKDFNLTYTPFTAGGYIPITGDSWIRTQAVNLPDTLTDSVQVSDSPKGILKGALWLKNASTGQFYISTTDWYRYGLTESRHYKEIVNLGVYNLTYRRFRKIQGEFDGTTYENNNDGAIAPIGFTPRYVFLDLPQQRYFVMVCPLTMNILKGTFSATFVEVYKDAADGTQEAASKVFKLNFK